MGQVTNKPIRTTRIEIVDSEGRVRIVLGFLGVGDGEIFGIAIRDEQGEDRAAMLHDGPAAEVALNYSGDVIAALTVAADGRASLVLPD